ncbi:MAG: hypothetical protein A3E83_01555 [Gammaproteobacteria bacterium RIFCSPHIGHO2_12_FULL_41_20]|nr:MAG: hypothetical protein A3E83_01555 [Gammaproteobacteria bacterium RIFCSPHIGHO2_12_FULL_41_20]
MNSRVQNVSSSLHIYIIAALSSILLSSWISEREFVINTDAICYLQSAETIGTSGLREAMHLCGQARWPFYSLLIFLFSAMSSLSYTASAYVLNGVFSCVMVTTFLAIIQKLGGSRRVLWLAALVILTAHEVNSVKQYIIRDHGFWAFYLLSCYLLLQYFEQFQRRYAFAWNVSLLMATLFRVEGAFFLIFLPWISWLYRIKAYRAFIDLNALTMGIVAILVGWLAFHPEQSLADWGRLQEIVSQATHGGYLVWQRFHETAINLGKYVLPSESARDASWVLFFVVMLGYVQNIIANLSVAYTLLVIYAWWKAQPIFKKSNQLVLYGYLFVNVLVTGVFFLQHLFLSKRYLIALSIILMVWVPFALDDLLKQYQSDTRVIVRRVFLPILALLIFISALGGVFDFGYSKQYIRNAGHWVALNVPKTARLYSNDSQVMYYSQHFGNEIFNKTQEYADVSVIEHGKWKRYDFLAIRINKQDFIDQSAFLQKLPLIPVRVFANKRGDQVRIYQVKGYY